MSATSEIGRAAPALLVAAAAWLGGCASAAEPLGRFPADPAQVSVSGISSGAFMANQLHIAHSAGIMGAGIIAAHGNVDMSSSSPATEFPKDVGNGSAGPADQ